MSTQQAATPKRRRTRISHRDTGALTLLGGLRAIRLDDVGRLLAYLGETPNADLSTRTTRRIVQRWRDLGLADLYPNPRGGLGIVTATRQTTAEQLPHGLPAWRDVPHTLTTSAVAVTLITSGWPVAAWVSDSQMQARKYPGHRPDGLLYNNPTSALAVEVERTTKSAQRWAQILPETITRYGRVLYFCEEATAQSLSTWAATNLTPEHREGLRVKPLGGLAR